MATLGYKAVKQFVYPSFVRLGKEANHLIHRATESVSNRESLSTMSSPKRYLWDGHKSKDEWNFMVLDGEKDNHILNIPGISEHLQSNGAVSNQWYRRAILSLFKTISYDFLLFLRCSFKHRYKLTIINIG